MIGVNRRRVMGGHDEIIMTSETNPEVLAVCYANGWAKHADYMTKREAEKVTSLKKAFYRNTDIKHFDELQYFGIQSFEQRDFQDCTALEYITLPSSIATTNTYLFRGCTSLKTVNKTNITYLATETFVNCDQLTTYTFDSGLTYIGTQCFSQCHSIRFTNDIPSSVTFLGISVFSGTGHTGLLTIPSGISVIPQRLFQGAKVSSVVIPSTVSEINEFAFYGCNNMSSLYVYATTPPTINGTNVFNNMTGTIYVPAESVEAYKTASGWSGLASRIQAIP